MHLATAQQAIKRTVLQKGEVTDVQAKDYAIVLQPEVYRSNSLTRSTLSLTAKNRTKTVHFLASVGKPCPAN
jgi:hypothetical protein